MICIFFRIFKQKYHKNGMMIQNMIIIVYYLTIVIMSKRWLRYGLVGNFLNYGLGTLFIAYTGWIIYDIGENNSTKIDEQLAKQLFTFSDAELKESARKAKLNFLARKQEKLRKFREKSQQRREQNKNAEYM